MSQKYDFISYRGLDIPTDQMEMRSDTFLSDMKKRRSVRDFATTPVPRSVIENIIRTAGSAPSGANMQPWSFCAISDPAIKKRIRAAAEKEEYENYHGRMNEEWLEDLAPLGTDWNKEFLEKAPWLIVMFKKPYDEVEGERKQHYYVNESVGIAAGFLISAIHMAGLVTLTHTPSPMKFLEKILDRPSNERAYLLLPVGYPARGATVPDIEKKSLDEIATFYIEEKNG